jgi:hypothetical protein
MSAKANFLYIYINRLLLTATATQTSTTRCSDRRLSALANCPGYSPAVLAVPDGELPPTLNKMVVSISRPSSH